MKFTRIDRKVLAQMEPILSLSAGYSVSMADELEYFDPSNSSAWILATDEAGAHLGFVRNFNRGSEWSSAEIYAKDHADRENCLQELLTQFRLNLSLPKGHRLRFDALNSDLILNKELKQRGFSERQQTLLHYVRRIDGPPSKREVSQAALRPKEIADVLTNLNPVSEEETIRWIDGGQIRVSFAESKVAAVAQVSESEEAIEVVRIATCPEHLRKGHAIKLLEEILAEAQSKKKRQVYLKVEDVRTPAIQLYEKLGFEVIQTKTEIWHSSWSRDSRQTLVNP